MDFDKMCQTVREELRVEQSFDVLSRSVQMDGRRAQLFFVDGMVQEENLSKVLTMLLCVRAEPLARIADARAFAEQVLSYGEITITAAHDDFVTFVLSGCLGLVVEGCTELVLVDVRSFPQRPVMEPENDRVLRGPREGFVESLLSNTALIRRRIRDPQLTMELVQVGARSHTDVALCYVEGRADAKLVERLQNTLRSVQVNTLTMGLESLTECMARRQWWNPFPRARSTERPDCAAASLAEGQVLLLVDGSPAALILPTGIFDFLQDTNDYCFLPVTGCCLRWLRLVVSVLSVLLIPIWVLGTRHPEVLPSWLDFVKIHQPIALPLPLQFLLIELVVAALKLASLNTPSTLSNSLAVIGALVLGDFAVQAELMVPETVLLMAFVAVADFAQPSYELGYALSFCRLTLLLGTWWLGGWGLLLGGIGMVVVIRLTPTLAGNSYWYPLWPCNPKALLRLFLRVPIAKGNN